MNPAFVTAILAVVEIALEELANDKELQSQVLNGAETVADWLQVKCGKVSKRSMEESIQLAMDTSVVRDEPTICEIISTITTLYATNEIERGAIVGGTLLSKFGDEIFPHIDKRELRFSRKINLTIYEHVLISVKNSFHEKMQNYDFKEYADFSNINGVGTSWVTTSAYSYQSKLQFIMNHGLTAFKFIKNLIKLKA